MGATGMTFKVEIGPRITNWRGVVKKSLQMGGLAFQREMKAYPSQAGGSTYRRTGALGNRVTFKVTGGTLLVGGPIEGAYALFGTGIFGPRGAPIYPTTKPFLAWQASGNHYAITGPRGGVTMAGKGDWIFARSVRGFIWPQKLEEVKAAMIEGVTLGFVAQAGSLPST